jgi:hypothetical protein
MDTFDFMTSRPTGCVTYVWGEKGLETGFCLHPEKAKKKRGFPPGGRTLCWTVLLFHSPIHKNQAPIIIQTKTF